MIAQEWQRSSLPRDQTDLEVECTKVDLAKHTGKAGVMAEDRCITDNKSHSRQPLSVPRRWHAGSYCRPTPKLDRHSKLLIYHEV